MFVIKQNNKFKAFIGRISYTNPLSGLEGFYWFSSNRKEFFILNKDNIPILHKEDGYASEDLFGRKHKNLYSVNGHVYGNEKQYKEAVKKFVETNK